jgi:hypothetical protein
MIAPQWRPASAAAPLTHKIVVPPDAAELPSATMAAGAYFCTPTRDGSAACRRGGANFASGADTTIQTQPYAGWTKLGACEPLTQAEQTAAQQLGLDPTAVYAVSGTEQQFVLPVGPAGSIPLGLRYESGTGLLDSAVRFRVIALNAGVVVGGSTFVVRRQ